LSWRRVRADLAAIYHWQPSELDDMLWEDMRRDHVDAIKTWNRLHGSEDTE